MPGTELADVAGAHQQPVRGHLGLRRVVAKRGEEEIGQAHVGAKDSRRRGSYHRAVKRTLDDDAGRTDAVRRAGNLAALAVVVFGIFYWLSTQVAELRAGSPWAEDPPDAIVSIAAMLVPFVAAVTFVRVQRWHGERFIPAAAGRDILRGIAIVLAAIWLTTAAAALAFVTGTRAADWDGGIGLLLGLLVATAVAAVPASVALVVAWPAGRSGGRRDDFLADASAFFRHLAARAPWRAAHRPLVVVAGWVDRVADAPLGPRRAPWLTVIGVALLAGVGFVVAKFVAEGTPPPELLGRAILALGGVMAAIVVVAYLALGRIST